MGSTLKGKLSFMTQPEPQNLPPVSLSGFRARCSAAVSPCLMAENRPLLTLMPTSKRLVLTKNRLLFARPKPDFCSGKPSCGNCCSSRTHWCHASAFAHMAENSARIPTDVHLNFRFLLKVVPNGLFQQQFSLFAHTAN